MKEPSTFEAFWYGWGWSHSLNRFRKEIAEVAATFEAVGAFNERQRLIAAGWIEPRPITRPTPAQSSMQRWPFMQPHEHEHQAVTGLNIPETP